jgi:hypothetical protein
MAISTQPYRTYNDLILEALANLGVLAAGQSVSPEDFGYIETRLASIFRKLAALEIVSVPDPDNIPGEWFVDLAAIVAGECALKFGESPDYVGMAVNAGLGGFGNVPVGAGTAARSLRIMLRGRPTGETLRTLSF